MTIPASRILAVDSTRVCTPNQSQPTAQAQQPPIKIGLLPPVTGPLASPGAEMVNGFRLFWEQANFTAGGRKVEIVTGDTTCNPDQALAQARRLVLQEKVQLPCRPALRS